MKRLLPSGVELALFAIMAFVCAAIAIIAGKADLALAALALPIFGISAWMGMRRSGQWQSFSDVTPQAIKIAEEETVG